MSPTEPSPGGSPRAPAAPSRPTRGPLDRRLIRLVPAIRRHVYVSGVAALFTAGITLVQAEALARLLPRMLEGSLDARRWLLVVLLTIAVARGALRWVTERSATHTLRSTRDRITELVLDRADALDEAGRAEATPSRAAALVTAGVDVLEPWVRSYVPALGLAAVVPVAAGLRILSVDVLSAVILLVAIPLIPLFMALIGQFTEARTARDWAMLQRLAGHFHDVLVGLPTLRLFGRAEAQVDRVRESADRYRHSAMRTLRVAFLSALVLELLATLSVALVAVSIGIRLADGRATLRTALVVLLLAPECSLPLRRVGAAYHAARTGADAADDLCELLAAGTTADGLRTATGEASIRMRGVTVTDPVRGHRVGPVDLEVASGELVALRAPSGGGKTTLLDAIRGQVHLTHGELRLGGVAADDLTRASRRAQLALVGQHAHPVGSRVDAAVALGAPAASVEAIRTALASVGLADLAGRPPTELSGGERQRLAVARAALRATDGGARIVLADEPTAHLDDDRATEVIAVLRRLADGGCSVLLATHDERLLRAVDRVVDLPVTTRDASRSIPTSDLRVPTPGVPSPTAPRATAPLVPGPIAGERIADGGGRGSSSGLGDLTWLRHVTRPVRRRLALARAIGAAADACTVGLAATAAWLIIRAASHPSFVDLTLAAVGVRAFGIGKGTLRYAERLASHDATFRLLGELRGRLVGHLAVLVPAGLPQMQRGEMITRVVGDIDRLGDLELRVLGPVFSALSVGVAATLAVAFVDGPTAEVLAAVLILGGGLLPALVARASSRTGESVVHARAALAASTTGTFEELDDLIANDAFVAPTARTRAASVALGALEQRRGRTAAYANGVVTALPVAAAGVVGYVASRPGRELSAPVLGLVTLLPLALIELLGPLITAAESLAPVAACASRLRRILETPDPTPEPAEPALPPSTTDVAFTGVSLAWPTGPVVVHDAGLALAAGERIVLRGPSGAGKSTIAAALVRFLSPVVGTYTVGRVDAEALGGHQVRRLVTWCTQDPWLADTTLRENLRIAAPDAPDAQLWTALTRAGLADWAAALPRGLDTHLGPNAVAASGGERQRLALARVTLADHAVVVLDEPTAHLDRARADAVMAGLLAALDGRSVVLITHVTAPGTWHRTYELVDATLHRRS